MPAKDNGSKRTGGVDRRTFLKAAGAFAVVCAGAGLGPLLLRRDRLFRRSGFLMGTVGEIQVVHDDVRKVDLAVEGAFEEMRRIERLMSHFSDASDVGRANVAVSGSSVPVSSETAEVVSRGLRWAEVTRGRFDPGIGGLSRIWDIANRKEAPKSEVLKNFIGRRFFPAIRVDGTAAQPSIRLTDDVAKLDLSGIAKGYAADRALQVIAGYGIDRALVNLGGDIATMGGRSRDDAWRVGIKDPKHPPKIAKVLHLNNQAVATSGTYEHYFVDRSDGRLYHHLIEPELARPVHDSFCSLTVVGDNCCDADALSTALFFLDDQDSVRLLEDHTERFSAIRLA